MDPSKYNCPAIKISSRLPSTASLCLLLSILLISACGGGGGDSESTDARVEISGAILVPGGTASPTNPIGLQGAANRPVSLYRIDDSGNIIGDVLDASTSDATGNYVLLLPPNIQYSSDIIVEADLGNNETARAIVIDATTDITPITEYITMRLIENPNLDMNSLPLEEVTSLIKFVESLPLGPQPDLSNMLIEIANFSDIAIEAEINDLATTPTQVRLSGLLSVPSPAPRPAAGSRAYAQKPVPDQDIFLYRIDDDGNIIGTFLATTKTNSKGVFSFLLPLGEILSGDLILQATVGMDIITALVVNEHLNIDATSQYVFEQIIQQPDVVAADLSVSEIFDVIETVYSLNIAETSDLASTLVDIDTTAGPVVGSQIDSIVNDAPTGTTLAVAALEETAITIDISGNVTDADGTVALSTTTVTGGPGNGILTNNNDGTFSYTGNVDFIGSDSFTYTVADDDGLTSADITVDITVSDINDSAPVVTPVGPFPLAENSANSTLVGTVSATDSDTVGGVTGFSIIAGNIATAFAIDNTGAITVANSAALDRETTAAFNLEITATDGTNTSAPETVVVTLIDVNDNLPVVDPTQSFVVAEDAVNTTIVGTVTASDPDILDTITGFTITGGNTGNVFAIDAGGVITVVTAAALDRETNASYTLTITASDGSNNSVAENVVINVTDINDNPPVVDPAQSFPVAENAIDTTVVGTVTASDPDSSGITGFNITGGNTGNAFAIDSGGVITVADTSAINFETSTSFTLAITATDGSNTSAAENVVITVTDVNDNPPVVDPAQAFPVAEDASDTTVVGTVTANDPDISDTITGFSITGGNTGNAFTIDASGVITVADTAAIDFESATSFTLSVTATDGSNTSAAESVTINVNDANDTSPVVTPAGVPFTPTENANNGTLVGTVAATDIDTVGSVTGFNITAGNTATAFAIDNAGAITVANSAALDRETTATFTLTITATDGPNLSLSEDFVINLTDLNDTAPVIATGLIFAVSSSATNSTVVGTVTATDADTTGAVTGFSITAGNTGGAFAIASNGEITVLDNSSLLTNSPYTLTLEATDGSNTSVAETVGITVSTTGAVWDNFNWDDGSTWQ